MGWHRKALFLFLWAFLGLCSLEKWRFRSIRVNICFVICRPYQQWKHLQNRPFKVPLLYDLRISFQRVLVFSAIQKKRVGETVNWVKFTILRKTFIGNLFFIFFCEMSLSLRCFAQKRTLGGEKSEITFFPSKIIQKKSLNIHPKETINATAEDGTWWTFRFLSTPHKQWQSVDILKINWT